MNLGHSRTLVALFLVVVSTLLSVAAVTLTSTRVLASAAILRPNGSPASSAWAPYGATTRHEILRNTSPVDSQWICRPASGNSMEMYDLTTVEVGQGAYGATATIHHAGDYKLFSSNVPYTVMGININGSQYGSLVKRAPPGSTYLSTAGCGVPDSSRWTSWTTYSTPVWNTSTPWTQTAVNNMKLILGAETKGDDRSMGVRQYYLTLYYDAWPKIVNYIWRAYENSNSLTPGAALASEYISSNTTSQFVQLSEVSQKFRLRLLTYNTTNDQWKAGVGSVRLVYAKKTASSCRDQTNWQTVTASSAGVRFYDNPNLTDGSNLSTTYSQDSYISSVTAQTYRESNDANVIASNYTLTGWDFSLQASSGAYGGSYCIKLTAVSPVRDEDSPTLLANSTPADIRLHPVPLSIDTVGSGGESIDVLNINFSPQVIDGTCKTSTASLGTTSQRLKVINGSATGGWSVGIAATGGPSALWSSVSGAQYDYNDPAGSPAGCSDGVDADNKGGQLSVNPSTATLQASEGCTTSGVLKGSGAAFSQGTTDAVTLMSATSAADMYCGWYMQGAQLTQKIPSSTPPGAYSLDMTMTVVAS